jgi:hypothetical protein
VNFSPEQTVSVILCFAINRVLDRIEARRKATIQHVAAKYAEDVPAQLNLNPMLPSRIYAGDMDDGGGQTDTPARRQHFFKANKMNDPKIEAAQKLFEQIELAPTMSSYQQEQQRVRLNFERLRAERLAREAAANNP